MLPKPLDVAFFCVGLRSRVIIPFRNVYGSQAFLRLPDQKILFKSFKINEDIWTLFVYEQIKLSIQLLEP